ncbi:hypothetical protein C0Q70_03557 [Pomacea canaliculata]|uniref:Uncharacterized protein n=1 Tax=Pomacea canaliculata TaxID=400727 RepID=A0A2T7PT18_POMCA|nr:hypothetical protein C0Q70_03557 [Pomacea canaliculata]
MKRHYETKHKNKYDGILGSSRTEKIAKLRQEIGGLTRIFSKKRQENEAAVIASYRVAHIFSREVKPFSDGECVKNCLLAVVEELCPEKKNAVEAVSLSRTTIARRVEDMGKHLQSKLRDKTARFEMFSIAAYESTDSSDTAQLLVFIRGTNSDFELTEELATMRGMHGNTTGEDLFKEVSAVIEGLALPWEKLVGVTTDGARSMVGCHSGLASRVIRKVVESNGTELLRLHCIIHQQNLCGKVLNLDHVMKIVVSTVNFIRSQALNHRTFKEFLTEIECEYEDVLFHSEVRWLSRGKLLKRFFDLRHEIEIFMTEKSKQVPQLNDPSWLWDLAILCDITSHLNELNTKLQGKDKLISHVYADITAFQAKLLLFIQQAGRMELVHFPTCTSLRQDQQQHMSFPKKE